VKVGAIEMKQLTYGSLFPALLFSLMVNAAWAQSTAQISGIVKDQTGAVLPGVEITAAQTATGLARTAVSNETGSYILPDLPIGPYRLEASLPGFRKFARHSAGELIGVLEILPGSRDVAEAQNELESARRNSAPKLVGF
jgi:hypothetical protein